MSSNLNTDVSEIKAVSILEMSKNGKGFQLKLDIVQEIFQSVENLPVAIISVSGALREGKSFILNLLLHYLLQQEKWHSNKNRKTYNVFKSRNGIESETIGINITNKPITLRDENDEKVAVFLMDTEGLFDKQRDAKECSTVFAMSCLLSSLQIYNVFRQVQESNLQHLQIFSNYAMATAGKKKKSASTSAPFQALMFLVRDWANRNIACNSKGAEEYLGKFLETDKAENKVVRQQIRSSFSKVRCHLLPRPGDEVALKDGDEIFVSDIADKFVQGVDNLGEQLFAEENLTAKKLNGITITGQGFVDLAVEYAAILHDGKMPKAESILKANRQVFVLDRTRQIEFEYHDSMKEKVAGKYINPSKLEELHKEYLQRALQQHNEMVKDSEPDEKERMKTMGEHMLIQLQTFFQAMQHDNNAKKKIQKTAIKRCISESGKLYKAELKKAAHGVYLEEVSGPSKHAQQQILEAFYKCTCEYDQEIVQECIPAFNRTIMAREKEFLNKNAQKRVKVAYR
ncbi:atlastin-2-like [Ciona intestinalis]